MDYVEGQVSFYDVEARSHIYSSNVCTFTETLFPFFESCNNTDRKNSALLIISHVNHTDWLNNEGTVVLEQTIYKSSKCGFLVRLTCHVIRMFTGFL